MSVQLRPEDGRALDLLLDRGPAANSGKPQALYVASDGVSEKRIRAVQSVLQLLESLPASDPPRDLLTRTLSTIQEKGKLATSQPYPDFQRPLA